MNDRSERVTSDVGMCPFCRRHPSDMLVSHASCGHLFARDEGATAVLIAGACVPMADAWWST